jgi:hypothetical protein
VSSSADQCSRTHQLTLPHSYCYGGKPALAFNTKGMIDVTVACHPSFVDAKVRQGVLHLLLAMLTLRSTDGRRSA